MSEREAIARLGIEAFLERYGRRELLRFLTCGSVDDGKSTLIGRLLHDAEQVYDDQLAAARRDSRRYGTTGGDLDLALLTDGLQAEREQGITIDVAYRYFATERRKFIIADTPGHEQFTRNMATGASTCDLAVILVDATKGVLDQTRRHAFIAALLGIRHLVVAVNKMDLAGYAAEPFERCRREFAAFAARLQVNDVHFIPLSALAGDNVVHRSDRMPWHQAGPLLDYLETVHIAGDRNLIDLRLPVQLVLRPHAGFRGYAGTVASGVLRRGDEVVALPGGRRARVATLAAGGLDRDEVFPPLAATFTLDREIDLARGDLLVHPGNAPRLEHALEAMVVWLQEEPLRPGAELLAKHLTVLAPARVAALRYRIDVNTLHRLPAEELGLNEIGRVALESDRPLAFDAYRKNRVTGAFVLIDRLTNATAGAGMILDRRPADDALSRRRAGAAAAVRPRAGQLGAAERERRLGHKPFTLWLTGLPRSGKTTLAYTLERQLFDRGLPVLVLDGENLRRGLSSDLGFSGADRWEHQRRAAEAARLLNEAGVAVVVALVSPLAADRAQARRIVGAQRFLEVHCDAPLAACEARDEEGLYARARAGEITGLSGVDAPYEAPAAPEIRLDTAAGGAGENAERVVAVLVERGLLAPPGGGR